jgi:hypothetical protein
MKTLRVLLLVVLLGVTACAGYQGGFASVPYVGDQDVYIPDAMTKFELWSLGDLELPGVKLNVALNNTLQTYDYAVMAVVVPIHVDPFEKNRSGESDRLQIVLYITPRLANLVFEPQRIVVSVDGQHLRPAVAWIGDQEKFKQLSQACYAAIVAASKRGDPAPRDCLHPAEYRNRVDTAMPLASVGHVYWFTVAFDVPPPAPDRAITLDLSQALHHPDLPTVPIIKFKKIRWSHSYT